LFQGAASVAIVLLGFFVAAMVAVMLPVGNMMVKGVAFCVMMALIVFGGLGYIGVI
jgi:hypothetical protein